MGIAQLPRIVEQLISHGAPPRRWVAIIEHATLPQQRVVAAQLDEIVERAQQQAIGTPALLIVGDVAEHACERTAGVGSSPLAEAQFLHGVGA
jgi:siroheme synthase